MGHRFRLETTDALTKHVLATSRLHRLVRRMIGEVGMGMLGLSLAISSADAQTPDAPPEPPAITSLRHDEDYSYLRDPGKRSGAWWESLKFIAARGAAPVRDRAVS